MAKAARRLGVVRTARVLDREERQDLASVWAQIVCRHCGWAHAGRCPRVRRVETIWRPNGEQTERLWYWPEGKWSVPPNAISEQDVFGPGGIPASTGIVPAVPALPVAPSEVIARPKRKERER